MIEMWKDSCWLAYRELRFQWPALLATTFAAVILASAAAEALVRLIQFLDNPDLYFYPFVLDLLFLGVTPSFAALFMSKPYLSFSTLSEDPFTKRMAAYRVMPISLEVISKSRIIFTLMVLAFVSSVFYTVIYLILKLHSLHLPQDVYTGKQFIIFALFWFGYALALSGFNSFIEFGLNSRLFFILPCIFIIIIVISIVLIHLYSGKSAVEWSLLFLDKWSWKAVALSLLAGVIGMYGWKQALHYRLKKRDYA